MPSKNARKNYFKWLGTKLLRSKRYLSASDPEFIKESFESTILLVDMLYLEICKERILPNLQQE